MSCRKKDSSNIPRANHQTPRQPTSGSWNAQPHSEQYQGPQKSKNQDLSTFSSKFQNPGFSYNGKTWIRQDDGSPAYPQPQNTFSDQNRKQNLIKIGKDEIDTTYFTRDELNLFLRDNLSQRNQFISKTEHQLRNLRDAIDLKTTGIAEAGQQMADILKYLEMLEMNELLLKSESEGFSETGRYFLKTMISRSMIFSSDAPLHLQTPSRMFSMILFLSMAIEMCTLLTNKQL